MAEKGKLRKVLGGCLMAAAGVSLLLVVLVAAAVGWGLHANGVADRQADAFCNAVKPGQQIASVLARAHEDSTLKRSFNDGGVYHFYWQGGVFYAGECEVGTAAGRVTAARRVSHDD